MLVITAGMDQKECYVWPCRKLFLAGRAVHPVVAQWLCLTVQTLLDQEIPQLLDTLIDVPVVQGRERSTCAVVEKTVVLPRLHCRGFPLEEQLINALMS